MQVLTIILFGNYSLQFRYKQENNTAPNILLKLHNLQEQTLSTNYSLQINKKHSLRRWIQIAMESPAVQDFAALFSPLICSPLSCCNKLLFLISSFPCKLPPFSSFAPYTLYPKSKNRCALLKFPYAKTILKRSTLFFIIKLSR